MISDGAVWELKFFRRNFLLEYDGCKNREIQDVNFYRTYVKERNKTTVKVEKENIILELKKFLIYFIT